MLHDGGAAGIDGKGHYHMYNGHHKLGRHYMLAKSVEAISYHYSAEADLAKAVPR